MKERIRDFSGKTIGWIEEKSNGDQEVTDFQGRIKGWYRKDRNVTTDFHGRVVGRGNIVTSLLFTN